MKVHVGNRTKLLTEKLCLKKMKKRVVLEQDLLIPFLPEFPVSISC